MKGIGHHSRLGVFPIATNGIDVLGGKVVLFKISKFEITFSNPLFIVKFEHF